MNRAGKGLFRTLSLMAISLALIVASAVVASAAPNVLIIWDVNDARTQALKTALENAGMTVTLSATDETLYDGTNPSPDTFNAIIHLNGTTYGTEMLVAGQNALVTYVQNGGGFVQGEWNAYEIDSSGTMLAMTEITLFQRTGGHEGDITYTVVPGMESHPVLAGVPASFTFDAGVNDGNPRSFAVNLVIVLMTEGTNPAVGVRQVGSGRVVAFSHAGNYADRTALTDSNVQRLYVNAVNWSSGAVTQPPADPVVLITPNGGETLKKGSTFMVTWTSDGVSDPVYTTRLQYNCGGGWTTFAVIGGNPGSYGWAIPKKFKGGSACKAKVHLRGIGGRKIAGDTSDSTFSIQ